MTLSLYVAPCMSLSCMHEHFTQTYTHNQISSPAKVLKFFCTRWHCALGSEKPPEHCDWIKAHKHHLWPLIDTVFLYLDFTPSDWLCCRGNRSKMGCTNPHGVIYFLSDVSKGSNCNAHSRWLESAKVTNDDTALREWISKVSLPGPGAEPLALVHLQTGNKSQALETYVL